MGTRNFRTNTHYALVSTTRYITVNSSLATRVVMGTGYCGISLFNQVSTPLIWGDSSIAVNSGNYLFPLSRIEWNPVMDNFEFYVLSDSNGTFGIAEITEYEA